MSAVPTRRPMLAEVRRRFGIRRLEIFGSASEGNLDPQRSDVDVLAQFGNAGSADSMSDSFRLEAQLEHLLGTPVDLQINSAVRSPDALAGIDATRKLIYAA